MKLLLLLLVVSTGLFAQCGILVLNPVTGDLNCSGPSGGAPSGAAGGDLSSTYPNPVVIGLNSVTLSTLTTGMMKLTAGIPSIGIPGIDYALPNPNGAGYQPNQTLVGCGVEYVNLLIFNVGSCLYTINGVTYTSAITSKTLTAADPSNPRIDTIGVDTAGTVFVTTGTAAASPAAPNPDPATQLALTFIYVAAGATTPTGPAITSIYEENTEWTSTATANVNAASTNNPYRGSKDVEFTAAVLTNAVTLVKPAAGTEILSNYNNLVFYLRSKATWPNGTGASAARALSVTWLSGSTQVGSAVLIRSTGTFGFESSSVSAYQQISIPVSLFGTGGSSVTSVKFTVSGNGGSTSIGFYLDAISLQSGVGASLLPNSVTNFKGTWASTTAYNISDIVVSGGVGYVALLANTNVAVTTTSTWASLAASHSIVFNLSNGTSAITTGDTGTYISSGAFTGLINRVDIVGYGTAFATCSITVDVWKKNAAIPTVSDKISASAPAALSTANVAQSFNVSTWTKAVAANDIWNANVASVTGCITARVEIFY